MLIWFGLSAPLWIIGASVNPELRLWWWAAAAFVDLVGVFTEHPLPGRRANTHQLPFDADHMLERTRLFLIILLGETVLSIGRAVSNNHDDALTLLAALGGFIALVSLWFTYFGRAEHAAIEHASATDDPIRAVHLEINVIYGVIIGLVAFAAGAQLVISHPEKSPAALGGALLLGGPILYLGGQAIYFRLSTGRDWLARAAGAALLGIGSAAAFHLPAMIAVALVTIILAALATHLSRPQEAPKTATR